MSKVESITDDQLDGLLEELHRLREEGRRLREANEHMHRVLDSMSGKRPGRGKLDGLGGGL